MPNWDRFTFTEKKPKTDIRKNDSTFLLGTKFCLEIIFSTAFRCLTFLAIFQSTNQSQRIQFNSIAIDKYAHIKHTAAIPNMNLINIWTICGCWTAIIHHTASSLNSISRSHSVLDATLFNFIVWLSGWTQPNSLKRWFSTELEVHCLIFNN